MTADHLAGAVHDLLQQGVEVEFAGDGEGCFVEREQLGHARWLTLWSKQSLPSAGQFAHGIDQRHAIDTRGQLVKQVGGGCVAERSQFCASAIS